MKKFFTSILCASVVFSAYAAEKMIFEAENFKGNSVVKDDADASGGKIVAGGQWYEMVKNVPIPAGKNYCFARVKSTAPVNWFCAYTTAKPFGWFKTSGEDKWVWVNLGRYEKNDSNKGVMPTVFLQKSSNAKVQGMVDLLIFSPQNNVAAVEKAFADYTSCKPAGKSYYLEAESFNGNGYIVSDASASGKKIVTGKTWYVLLKNVPIPESENGLYCFVRVRSSLKAQWFLAYDTRKPFGWFQTPGDEKWVWVNLGKFMKKDSNKGIMPQVFMQKPVGSTAQTTDGAADAVVFSETPDAKEAERLFQESLKTVPVKMDSASAEKLSALTEVQRFYSLIHVDEAPVIDGDINDAAYRNAPKAADFILLGGKSFASQQTEVKAVWHKDTIYIAAKLYESKMGLLRKLRNKDNDSVWTDDCFEMYFDPGHTRTQAFQLVVNPNGAKQDVSLKRRIDEAGFSDMKLSWQVKTRIADNYWTVEAAIPLKLLSFLEVKEGTVWGMNFCRSEIPYGEKSYWNNTGGYFFKPDRFAVMHFGQAPGNLQSVAMDSQSGTLKLNFAPQKTEKISAQGTVRDENISANASENLTSGKAHSIALKTHSKSRKYTVDVKVASPEKSTTFAVDVRNYRDGLFSVLWPCEDRGNRLPLLYGTAQHAFWIFANHTQNKVENLEAVVTVPEGLKLLDPTSDVKYDFFRKCKLIKTEKIIRNNTPHTRHTIAIEGGLGVNNLRNLRFFQGITLFFECESPAFIGKKLSIYTSIRAGDIQEEENVTTVEILPPVTAQTPEKLVIHNWLWTWNPCIGSLEGTLRTMKQVGFNSLEASGGQFFPGRREAFAKYGFPLVNNMWWEFHGTADGAQAVKFDGSVDNKHLCPSKMLADNSKLLLQNRSKQLTDIAEGSNGIVWDLEGPYCWNICFCKECIENFRKFASIAQDKSLTPKIIRENYNAQWIKYCCRQSTEICRILRNSIKKINPKAKFGFYSGLPSFDTMESYRADWDDAIGDIDLALLSYYTNSFTALDDTFNSKMKEHIANLRSAAKKAGNDSLEVWATLTPGYERNSSIKPTAELVKLKVLRSFASGMDGVTFWWWGPFDGEFYRELVTASTIVGKYEKFFLNKETPVSLKAEILNKARGSFFTSKVGNEEFMLVLNHGSKEITVNFDNPAGKVWVDEFSKKSWSSAKFTVKIPPCGTLTLFAEK
ncbi:MAG: hypothetical protein IJC27_02120 [Lentisphaeria bacterium]|nr:hypothetical protein [Lentisphaeria bacterium]